MADTETNQLIIYVGTQQKIDQARQQGQITADDFVVVTDAPDYALASDLQTETTNRTNADNNLQQQIDAITASSDVTDIVGTYAELQAYDTSSLPPNSIIKVLNDESRNGETTYYRWVVTGGTGTWVLIGEEGPYYTKGEADGKFVPQTRTVNGKALSNNISLDASDVGALPDSTVIPTDTSDLTNGAGFITSAALSGYATQQWVVGQGYLTGITSVMVTTALGYTPVNPSSLATVATTGDYDDLINQPTIPTSADYWTVGTQGVSNYQTTYSKKTIFYTASGAQDNGFKVLASSDTAPSSTVGAWSGRCLFGNEKRTFLLGTARNSASGSQSICGIGAHTWGSATSQTSAAWDNFYLNPDGNMGVYIGGNGWRGSSGWMRVLNNNSGNAGYRVAINTGTAASPTWRTVLPNQASGTSSVQIVNAVGTTHAYNYCASLGGTATANYGSSFGYSSSAGNYGVALGASAVASGNYAIQLGYGTNSTANTMNVGLSSSLNVQLLNSSGKIPAGRLPISTSVDSSSTNDTVVGAKLLYDTVGNIETALQNINSGS